MTHDPMCPQYDCWLEGCTVCDECALIARVREDERKKYETYSNARKVGREQGYKAALSDAVEAIAADSEFDDVRDQWHAIEIIEALGGER